MIVEIEQLGILIYPVSAKPSQACMCIYILLYMNQGRKKEDSRKQHTHMIDMGPVLGEAAAGALVEELVEDLVDGDALGRVGLVEGEHADEDGVPLVHEVVARQVQPVPLVDGARRLDPVEHQLPVERQDRRVGPVRPHRVRLLVVVVHQR